MTANSQLLTTTPKTRNRRSNTMSSKITTNSQQSTTDPKKQKQTKHTTRTGTESQKQRSHGGLPVVRGKRENGGKGTGNKKHKWQVQNRQEEVKNSMGNGEAKVGE